MLHSRSDPEGGQVARVLKENKGLNSRLDELERRMFVLKLQYEKYFSGLERREPIRERDEVKRFFHDFCYTCYRQLNYLFSTELRVRIQGRLGSSRTFYFCFFPSIVTFTFSCIQ